MTSASRVLLAPGGVLHHEPARLAEDGVVARRAPRRAPRRESPAAGWTYSSSNGVSRRMRPLATLLSATPPAMHSRVRARLGGGRAAPSLRTTSSVTAWMLAATSA